MSSNIKFSTTDLLHAIREIPKNLINSGERLALVMLLACMNADNETWHSVESIAEFTSMGLSTFKRHLKAIEKKKFIIVDRPSSHYTHGVTNHYHLNLDYILSFHVNNSRISVGKSQSNLNPDTQVAVQIEPPSQSKSDCDRSPNRATKIDIKKERKKERAEKEIPAPLSEDFQASRATKDIVYEMGFTREDMELAFPDFYRHYYGEINTLKGWDMKFRGWMRQKRKYDDNQLIKNQPSPTERKDPFKEEELKMKRFGGLSTVGNLVK